MRLQRLTNFLLSQRWATFGLTLLVSVVPGINIVTTFLAALVTLRKSVVEGAIITVIATTPFIASYVYYYPAGTNEFIVAVLSYVLTWVFAIMLRERATWSQILQTAALLGVLVISIAHMVYPSLAEWWEGQLIAYYKHASAMMAEVMNQPTVALSVSDSQLELIDSVKQYMTGITATVILLNAIVQLIVGRWWEAAVYTPGMLRRELHNIRLSSLAGGLFILSMIFAYLGNRVVLDIMPVLYGLFAASGLSLMHYLIGLMKTKMKWFWVFFMYLTLLIGFPASIVLLAMLGLLDIWVDMRKRLQRI